MNSDPENPSLLSDEDPVSGLEAFESYVGGILGIILGTGLILNLSGIVTGQLTRRG